MTKIIVNCRYLTQEITGVQRFAYEITRALCEIRPDVVLVAPRVPIRPAEVAGAHVYQFGHLAGHLWEQVDLARFMRKHPGATLLNLANTGPLLIKDQVVTIHDVTYRMYPRSFTWRFRVWYRLMHAVLARRSQAVLTVSEFSKREIMRIIGVSTGKVSVVPNAADHWKTVELQRPASVPIELDFFLVVGSRARYKGFETALRAFSLYRTHGGTAHLLVVGGSVNRVFQPTTFGVGHRPGNVRYLGRVPEPELAWLYSHCRAFISPSLYEGFGIPPLEAQWFGAPVIASEIPATVEVLPSWQTTWFSPGNAKALANAMAASDRDSVPNSSSAVQHNHYTGHGSWITSAHTISRLCDALATGASQ